MQPWLFNCQIFEAKRTVSICSFVLVGAIFSEVILLYQCTSFAFILMVLNKKFSSLNLVLLPCCLLQEPLLIIILINGRLLELLDL